VFLSPRVIDQRGFDELASQLRAAVDEARRQAAALTDAAQQAAPLARAGQDAARNHQSAVAVLGKLLLALNARVKEVDELLALADRRASELRAIEQSATSSAESALAAFQSRLSLAADEAVSRVESRLAEALQRLDACITGDGDRPGLAPLVDDAERLKDGLNTAASRLERALGASVEQAVTLKDARAEAGVSILRLREVSDEASMLLAPLITAAGKAARVNKELHAELDAAEQAHARAGSTGRQLTALLERASQAQQELTRWDALLNGAAGRAELPAPLAKIVGEFRRGIAQDLAKMAGAMSLIAKRAETTVQPGPEGTPEIVIRVGGSERAGAPGDRDAVESR